MGEAPRLPAGDQAGFNPEARLPGDALVASFIDLFSPEEREGFGAYRRLEAPDLTRLKVQRPPIRPRVIGPSPYQPSYENDPDWLVTVDPSSAVVVNSSGVASKGIPDMVYVKGSRVGRSTADGYKVGISDSEIAELASLIRRSEVVEAGEEVAPPLPLARRLLVADEPVDLPMRVG